MLTLCKGLFSLGRRRPVWFARMSSSISVCVEGNIASGKTTCLEFFKKFDSIEVQEEPVKEWRNIEGFNVLATMYADPERWTYTFQTFALLTLFKRHVQPRTHRLRVSERSLYSARYCFIENQYKKQYLTDMEYVLLSDMFNWYTQTHDTTIDLFVYLRTRPEIVLERIKVRQRPEECNIPLNFLQELHELHEDWLIKKKNLGPSSYVLVLDANKSMASMQEEYKKVFSPILQQTLSC